MIVIEITTPQRSPEVPISLLWQKSDYVFGEECIALAGPFTHDQDRAETAVRKDGRCQRIFQQSVIARAHLIIQGPLAFPFALK